MSNISTQLVAVQCYYVNAAGVVNDDNELRLGGQDREYDGCPKVLILNHFFDGAVDPATEEATVVTSLVLVPCTQNFVNQRPTRVTAQYLVFNEFEQRFSTSAPVDCFSLTEISNIDEVRGPVAWITLNRECGAGDGIGRADRRPHRRLPRRADDDDFLGREGLTLRREGRNGHGRGGEERRGAAVPGRLRRDFAAAGVSHVLAISGVPRAGR